MEAEDFGLGVQRRPEGAVKSCQTKNQIFYLAKKNGGRL
jgi:hypothetical protein